MWKTFWLRIYHRLSTAFRSSEWGAPSSFFWNAGSMSEKHFWIHFGTTHCSTMLNKDWFCLCLLVIMRFTRSEPLTDYLTNSKQLTLNLSWLDGDECGNHNLLVQTTVKWFWTGKPHNDLKLDKKYVLIEKDTVTLLWWLKVTTKFTRNISYL